MASSRVAMRELSHGVLAASALQFVDLSLRLVSKSSEIAKSADGRLSEHADLSAVTADLQALTNRLAESKALLSIHTSLTEDDQALILLSQGCFEVSRELQQALNKLQGSGKASKWRSLRKALKTIWSKEQIDALQRRLSLYRGQLDSRTLAGIAMQVNQSGAEQAEGFRNIDDAIQLLEANFHLSRVQAKEQLAKTIQDTNHETQEEIQVVRGELQQLTQFEERAQAEHVSHSIQIQEAISASEANIRLEQQQLSGELSRQLALAEDQITGLRKDIQNLEATIADTVAESIRASKHGKSKEWKRLNEYINSLYRLWVAKDIVLQDLLLFVAKARKLVYEEWTSIRKAVWKLVPYGNPQASTATLDLIGLDAIASKEADTIELLLLFKAIYDGNLAWLQQKTSWHPFIDARMEQQVFFTELGSWSPFPEAQKLFGEQGAPPGYFDEWSAGMFPSALRRYRTDMTPLIYAVLLLDRAQASNRERVLDQLLASGASRDIQDGKGRTVYDHAEVLGFSLRLRNKLCAQPEVPVGSEGAAQEERVHLLGPIELADLDDLRGSLESCK